MKKMPLKELGALVHENRGCATCHSLDGTRGQGPSWKGIWGQTHTFADGSFGSGRRELHPAIDSGAAGARRPGFRSRSCRPIKGLLRDREILGVIEFIKTLK